MTISQTKDMAAHRFLERSVNHDSVNSYYLIPSYNQNDTTINVYFPKMDSPYTDGGVACAMVKGFIVKDAVLENTDIKSILYSIYIGNNRASNNFLHKVVMKDDEYLFGQGIVLKNRTPLVSYVTTYPKDAPVSKTLIIALELFRSANPIHKFLTNELFSEALNHNIKIVVNNSVEREWGFRLTENYETMNKHIIETLLQNIDEIYGDCAAEI